MRTVICVIIKDEQRYVREWVQYHLDLGFDALYLYEDWGSHSHAEVLADYISGGEVFLTPLEGSGLPITRCDNRQGVSTQMQLFCWFLDECKEGRIDADWVGFFDVDEFLTFEDGWDLAGLEAAYADTAGVLPCWLMYGANGHLERPAGGVVANYTEPTPLVFHLQYHHKSLVNVMRCAGCIDVHTFQGCVYTDGTSLTTPKVVYEKCYLRHYFTKSWADYCERMEHRGNMGNNDRCYDRFFMLSPELASLRDMLLEERRWNSSNPDTMYISHERRIISGGNKRRLRRGDYERDVRERMYAATKKAAPFILRTPYVPRMARICDGVVVQITPKCGCSTIAYVADRYAGAGVFSGVCEDALRHRHFLDVCDGASGPNGPTDLWAAWNETVAMEAGTLDEHDRYIVIWRDPIERVLSAKHTLAPAQPLSEFLEDVVATFRYHGDFCIDQHLLPQSYFCKAERVDEWVELKDLSAFLEAEGIAPVRTNMRREEEREYDEDVLDEYRDVLREIYKDDYAMRVGYGE